MFQFRIILDLDIPKMNLLASSFGFGTGSEYHRSYTLLRKTIPDNAFSVLLIIPINGLLTSSTVYH